MLRDDDGIAVKGQPARLMGTRVEQQHACAQQGISV